MTVSHTLCDEYVENRVSLTRTPPHKGVHFNREYVKQKWTSVSGISRDATAHDETSPTLPQSGSSSNGPLFFYLFTAV